MAEQVKLTKLKCNVCKEHYSQYSVESKVPRLLTKCGHTICESCATKIKNNGAIICPFDKIESLLPDDKISHLLKNTTILQAVLEQEKADASAKNEELKIPCDQDKNHTAIFYCINCQIHLCQQCSVDVHSAKVFDSHRIVKVTEKPELPLYCPKHPHNIAELYCKEPTCNEQKLMCTTCHLYKEHAHHSYDMLEDKLQSLSLIRDEAIDISEKNLEKAKDYCSTVEKALSTYNKIDIRKEAEREIKQYCEQIHQSIDQWKIKWLADIDNFLNSHYKIVQDTVNPALYDLENLSNTLKHLKKMTSFEKPTMIQMAEEIEKISEMAKNFVVREPKIHHLNPEIGLVLGLEGKVQNFEMKMFSPRKLHLISDFPNGITNVIRYIEEESTEICGKARLYKNQFLEITHGELPENLDFTVIIHNHNYYNPHEMDVVKKLEKLVQDHQSPTIKFVAAYHQWHSEERRWDIEAAIQNIVASDSRVHFIHYDCEYKDRSLAMIDFALQD